MVINIPKTNEVFWSNAKINKSILGDLRYDIELK